MISEQEWREKFSRNLLDIMTRWKMDQAELAFRTGLSQGTISNYLNGRTTPSVYAMMRICDVLELPISFINWD